MQLSSSTIFNTTPNMAVTSYLQTDLGGQRRGSKDIGPFD
jgi:hypothetical protein